MALAVYGIDPPLFTSTAAPTGGVPSLSPADITSIYMYYGGRAPDSNELATDTQSALKYSAAGVERQIATRFSNVPGSGVTGNAGPSLTVAAPTPVPATNVLHVISDAAPTLAAQDTGALPAGSNGLTSTSVYSGPVGPVSPLIPGGSNGLSAFGGASGGGGSTLSVTLPGTAPATAAGVVAPAASGLFGLPPIVLLAGAGALAFYFLKGKRS